MNNAVLYRLETRQRRVRFSIGVLHIFNGDGQRFFQRHISRPGLVKAGAAGLPSLKIQRVFRAQRFQKDSALRQLRLSPQRLRKISRHDPAAYFLSLLIVAKGDIGHFIGFQPVFVLRHPLLGRLHQPVLLVLLQSGDTLQPIRKHRRFHRHIIRQCRRAAQDQP